MNRIRGGPLILCLVTLLVMALSVTMSLTTQDNSTPSTAAYAAIFMDPLDAAATSEVVVPGNTAVSITPSAYVESYDATIAIWSAGPVPPLDVGQCANALTSTSNFKTNMLARGAESDARAKVATSIAMKEDGTHRFTAART